MPPVRANEVYKRCREAGGLFASTIKWHYLDYFPLVRVVRQGDASFSALLTKTGDGKELDDREVLLIESRFVTTDEALVRAPSAVRIFYSNQEVAKFNTFVAMQEGTDVVKVRAEDTYIGYADQDALRTAIAKVDNMTHTEFANRPREITVVIGKPYMISTNIDVVDGLVNGAVGILVACERSHSEGNLPKRFWLEFDQSASVGRLNRLRSKWMAEEARRYGYAVGASWVPIEPRSTTVTLDRKTGVACKRVQFPLVEAQTVRARG